MKVTLLSYNKKALELLLATKETRLGTSAALHEISGWSEERKHDELSYMLDTIQSSWEFVHYVFGIEGVSRAFTHQLVRTRQGSYAQESQRTVNKSGSGAIRPDAWADDNELATLFTTAACDAMDNYNQALEYGARPQDARSMLLTNIETSITAGFDLRTLSNMAKLRLCYRTQGEYQTVFRAMRDCVIEVHPWAEPFIRVHCASLGVCAFPRYEKCPIKPGIFNADTGLLWQGFDTNGGDWYPAIADGGGRERLYDPKTKSQIQKEWEDTRHEATPTIVPGKAQTE